jgi:hypothetical protein
LVTDSGSRWINSSDLSIGLSAVANQVIITNNAVVQTWGNLAVGPGSVLRVSIDATNYLGGSFDNRSTNDISSDFSGSFIFNGGTSRTQAVEVGSILSGPGILNATNFFFGAFYIGDPVSGSNAFVQLVDNRTNQPSLAGNEVLAASNVTIATTSSVLDLNNRTGLVYNLVNIGTIQQTNSGNPPGVVAQLLVVNTFTNQGAVLVGNGSVLQFSNAFVNAAAGTVSLSAGGVLTNFLNGSVLTNVGTVQGNGILAAQLGNEGSVTATGGLLRLTGGFTNSADGTGPINAGLLRALGCELRIETAFTNIGQIAITNGIFTVTNATGGPLTLVNQAVLGGYGLFNAKLANAAGSFVSNDTGSLLIFQDDVEDEGTITAVNGSSLEFRRSISNASGGRINVINQSVASFQSVVTNASGATLSAGGQSLLQFNSGLTNIGTLAISGASTSIISGTLLLGSSGVITMATSNDTLFLRGDFLNGSLLTNSMNLRYGTIWFGGTNALTGASTFTNTFEIAGTNKFVTFAGFNNNMAIGTLNITNHIEFVNYINNLGGAGPSGTNEALYVDVLHLFNGATMRLSAVTVYVGSQFIYEDGNGTRTFSLGAGATINEFNKDGYGLVNVFMDNGGQIVFVPEPSGFVLLLLGGVGLVGLRRRRGLVTGAPWPAGAARPTDVLRRHPHQQSKEII